MRDMTKMEAALDKGLLLTFTGSESLTGYGSKYRQLVFKVSSQRVVYHFDKKIPKNVVKNKFI